VTVRDIGGATDIQSTFGRIEATLLRQGGRVTGGNADVTVADVTGALYVKTSFGQVRVDRISGGLTAENNNGAVRGAGVKGGIVASTSFAPIVLTVPEGLGMALSATTSFGTIRSDVPLTTTGAVAKDSLQGTVGGGGCPVTLTNANGNVEIRKALP
jgi:hypothetical protein